MASGDTLFMLLANNMNPPANGGVTGDVRNAHPVIDMVLGEYVDFTFILPRNYVGTTGITLYLHFGMSSATTGDIKLQTAFERIGDNVGSIGTDGFAAAQSTGDVPVLASNDKVKIVTTSHTNGAQLDNLAVGELGRLRVTRAAVAGTDAVGDLELHGIELKET